MEKKYYDMTLINNIKYELSNKNFNKAQELINAYQEKYPDDIMGIVCRARLLKNKKSIRKALNLLEYHMNDKFHSTYVELEFYREYASLLEINNREEEAEKAYIHSTEISDNSVISTLDLARFYLNEKDFEKAEESLNKCKKLDDPQILILKAEILYKEEKYEESSELLKTIDDKSIKRKIRNEKYEYLALNYYKLNNIEYALKYINCINSKDASMLVIKNKLLSKIKTNNDVTKTPNNKRVNRLLFKNYMGCYNFKEAKRLADSIKDESEKLYYYGRLKLLSRNFNEAEKLFCKSLFDAQGEVFEHDIAYLALTYLRLNELDNLKTLLNHAENEINEFNADDRMIIANTKLLLKKKDNHKVDFNNLSYASKQIYNYSKKSAIKHIYEHHVIGFLDKALFDEGTNVEELIDRAREKILDMKPLTDDFFDRYYITLDDTNIEVITNMSKKQIITMYPVNFVPENIEENKKEDTKKRVLKRETQIEKFNRRYGKKENVCK